MNDSCESVVFSVGDCLWSRTSIFCPESSAPLSRLVNSLPCCVQRAFFLSTLLLFCHGWTREIKPGCRPVSIGVSWVIGSTFCSILRSIVRRSSLRIVPPSSGCVLNAQMLKDRHRLVGGREYTNGLKVPRRVIGSQVKRSTMRHEPNEVWKGRSKK